VKVVATLVFGIAFTCFLVTVMALVFAAPVMWLWNAVIPDIFHLKPLTLLQALWLSLLCGLLFGSQQRVRIKTE